MGWIFSWSCLGWPRLDPSPLCQGRRRMWSWLRGRSWRPSPDQLASGRSPDTWPSRRSHFHPPQSFWYTSESGIFWRDQKSRHASSKVCPKELNKNLKNCDVNKTVFFFLFVLIFKNVGFLWHTYRSVALFHIKTSSLRRASVGSWIEKIVLQASGLAGAEPFLDLLDSMSVFSAKLGFENLLSKLDDSCQIYIETCQT